MGIKLMLLLFLTTALHAEIVLSNDYNPAIGLTPYKQLSLSAKLCDALTDVSVFGPIYDGEDLVHIKIIKRWHGWVKFQFMMVGDQYWGKYCYAWVKWCPRGVMPTDKNYPLDAGYRLRELMGEIDTKYLADDSIPKQIW